MRGLQSFRWPVKLALLVIALLAVIAIGSGWWLPWDPAAIDLQQRLRRPAKVDIDKGLHRLLLNRHCRTQAVREDIERNGGDKNHQARQGGTHGWV